MNNKIKILKNIVILTFLLFTFIFTTNSFAASTAVNSFNIKQSDVTIFVGKWYQLNTTISPKNATNKKLIWSSSNPKVATVSQTGIVHGIKSGKTKITAKTSNGKIDTCIIRVSIPAKSIKLTKKYFTMPLNCTTHLTVSFNPINTSSKEITWKSSNPDVVSIYYTKKPNATLLSKKEGTATITATSKYGVKATCFIRVQKQHNFDFFHAINVHDGIHAKENGYLAWQGKNVDTKGGTLGAYEEAVNILNGKNYRIYEIYNILVKAHPELKTNKEKEPYQYTDINSRFNMRVYYAPANITEVKKALQSGKLVQLQVHSNKWRNSRGELLSWPGYHSGLIFCYDGIHFHMKAAGKINQKNSIYTEKQLVEWIGGTSKKLIIYSKK